MDAGASSGGSGHLSLLMRFTDDYFFISDSAEVASRVLS